MELCRWFMEEDINPQLIIFSDEKWFFINSTSNCQNFRHQQKSQKYQDFIHKLCDAQYIGETGKELKAVSQGPPPLKKDHLKKVVMNGVECFKQNGKNNK